MDSVSKSTDIEVLCIIIGIGKTSRISQISEDSLQKMLGKLRPENHKFFLFLRDCLIQIIKKIGPQDASKKIGISVPVLKTIEKITASKFVPMVAMPNKAEKTEKQEEIKQKVRTFYNCCKSITKTAKNFNISKEKAISWVIGCSDNID